MTKIIAGVGAAVVIGVAVYLVLFGNNNSALERQEGETPIATVAYQCNGGKSIMAAYFADSVQLLLDGEEAVSLSQTVAASGARFANADESFVFWRNGEETLVMRNNSMDLNYTNCRTAAEAACPTGQERVGEGCMLAKDACELGGGQFYFDEATGECRTH